MCDLQRERAPLAIMAAILYAADVMAAATLNTRTWKRGDDPVEPYEPAHYVDAARDLYVAAMECQVWDVEHGPTSDQGNG